MFYLSFYEAESVHKDHHPYLAAVALSVLVIRTGKVPGLWDAIASAANG